MSDEEAFAHFVRRYPLAKNHMLDYSMARILSGRLRELDKRTRKANTRADAAEAELAARQPVSWRLVNAEGTTICWYSDLDAAKSEQRTYWPSAWIEPLFK